MHIIFRARIIKLSQIKVRDELRWVAGGSLPLSGVWQSYVGPPPITDMSDTDTSVPQLLSELTRSLEALQDELEEPPRGFRPPSPAELSRFTSEVTIPAVILVLETNIRALRLVQRALRIADGRDAQPDSSPSQTRERAVELGQATLSRLDDALGDLQETLEERPPEDDARQLLQRVQDIEHEIEAKLETTEAADGTRSEDPAATNTDSIDIDVDAELQSLKDTMDDDSDDLDGNDNS